MYLSSIGNIQEFEIFLSDLVPTIGYFGGRFFKKLNSSDKSKFKLNDIVRAFDKMIKTQSIDPSQNGMDVSIKNIIQKIKFLDKSASGKLVKQKVFVKLMTSIRQFFGGLFFKRFKILSKYEFLGKFPVTSNTNYYLLHLKGENGAVACRTRGEGSNIFPKISEGGNVECTLRSKARLSNLTAVRGDVPGARMVGPCDYFGNLETPNKYKYTIEIRAGFPHILREESNVSSDAISFHRRGETIHTIDLSNIVTRLNVKWHSGFNNPHIKEIKQKYIQEGQQVLGRSLFPNSGILEIEGHNDIPLKMFDASKVDFSSFKAQLVDNATPFQITTEELPSLDEYRAVSYLYEPQYARMQVEKGGGLFLETHGFAQTITPLDENASGFVTLAKWVDEGRRELEVIAIEIPFGKTLIVEKNCIHGDTNLSGMFMMNMTSNHKTMQTADCVFLKSAENRRNVNFFIENVEAKPISHLSNTTPAPLVRYRDTTEKSAFKFYGSVAMYNLKNFFRV